MTLDFSKFKSVGIILFVVLLAHGPNILNDGVYTDGWMLYHYVSKMDVNVLFQMYADMGIPAWQAYYWLGIGALSSLGDFVLVSRIVVFCVIATTSVAMYGCLRQFKLFSERECVLCCIVAASYFSFQVEPDLAFSYSTFCVMCFYVGMVLYLKSLIWNDRLAGWALQVVSVPVLFLSFNLHSLLVYYYGFLVIIHYCKLNGPRKMGAAAIVRQCAMYLLPIFYWLMKVGLYAKASFNNDGNTILLSPFRWGVAFVKFLLYGVNGQFALSITQIIAYPFLFCAAYILARKLQSIDDSHPITERNTTPAVALAVGVWLFIASIVAYVLVGKSPLVTGWESRHSILIAFPVGIILVGLIRVVTVSARSEAVSRFGALFVVASLVFGFMVTNWKETIAYELNWIRDKAFMTQLREKPEWKDFSVYIIQDESEIPTTVYYHEFTFAGMLSEALGGESRIGFRGKMKTHDDWIKTRNWINSDAKFVTWFMIKDLNPDGKRIALIIRRHGDMHNLKILVMYYYYKYIHSEGMDDFLHVPFMVERIPLDDAFKM
jgi:hypothetical protein